MQCAIKEIEAGRSRQLTLSDIKSGTFQQMIQILIIRFIDQGRWNGEGWGTIAT